MKIEEIGVIYSGVRLTQKNMKIGETPFVWASDNNNGITNFVKNHNNSLDANVLGINYNGSIWECFYHPYSAIFSDDVKRLKIRSWTKFHYLFLKTSLLAQKEKYSYGYKLNEKRLKKQKILLPCNDTGKINWKWMSNFIKQNEFCFIANYLLFLKENWRISFL